MKFTSLRRKLLAVTLPLLSGLAAAQLVDPDPQWLEGDVPPPPAFDLKRGIAIEMPAFLSLRFAVDPQTLSVGPDGVVRYVMMAASDSGVVNAMYEGIRCNTSEVRTYARYNSGSGWTTTSGASAEWRGLRDRMPSHHAAEFARQGACDGRAAQNSPQAIIRALKSPPSQL
ncbi:MAG: CNP1-like family protein [Burkholderiaceae bacterium]|nr:CNP1-like family protein [Burkholderiaceae bacterium]